MSQSAVSASRMYSGGSQVQNLLKYPFKYNSDEIKEKSSGRGAVRLAHLFWEQGAAGSNPAAPTTKGVMINFVAPFFV